MQNSISDDFFGALTWDALVDRWSGEMAFPGGHGVKIMIGTPDGENDQTITPEAREVRWTPKIGPVVKLCDYGGYGLGDTPNTTRHHESQT